MITGATGGIGGALIKKFTSLGGTVLATGTKIEKLESIKKNYPNVKVKKFNLSEYGQFDLNINHRFIGDHIDWTGSKNEFVKSVDILDMSIRKNWFVNIISLNFSYIFRFFML